MHGFSFVDIISISKNITMCSFSRKKVADSVIRGSIEQFRYRRQSMILLKGPWNVLKESPQGH